jgi:hydrogenase maturation protease
MNRQLVDEIVHAVLYEGYILYPYRPSVKNQQRWTLGGLYPEPYAAAQRGSDASTLQAECVVLGTAETSVDVSVRFLHLVDRTVGELDPPLASMPDGGDPAFRPVEWLDVGPHHYQPWQEAVERDVNLRPLTLRELVDAPRQQAFTFARERHVEPLRAADGRFVGVLVRERQEIVGSIDVSAVPVDGGAFKLTVRVANRTDLVDGARRTRDEALTRSLVSTHAVLALRGGEFVSLTDPPERWLAAVDDCHNVGTWPVLVGDHGERDTMLASPIILYDHPQLAPESPGDLFDATEIDEILSLRILALTDDEKRIAAALDDRARAMLDRTESLAREQLASLHGTIREMKPAAANGGAP